jgi:hypothetical protein
MADTPPDFASSASDRSSDVRGCIRTSQPEQHVPRWQHLGRHDVRRPHAVAAINHNPSVAAPSWPAKASPGPTGGLTVPTPEASTPSGVSRTRSAARPTRTTLALRLRTRRRYAQIGHAAALRDPYGLLRIERETWSSGKLPLPQRLAREKSLLRRSPWTSLNLRPHENEAQVAC